MAASSGPDIVEDGLVLYLDAANPRSYPGSGTVWNDMSGNGNNGTLKNGVGHDSLFEGRMIFDGGNDYVDLGLNNLSLSQATFSVVVQNPESGGCFSKGIVNQTEVGITFGYSPLLVVARPYFYSGQLTYPISNITTNVFFIDYTVVSNGVTKLYINGEVVAQRNIPEPLRFSGTYSNKTENTLPLVMNYHQNSNYSNCEQFCTKLYNRALSEAEVKQNFEATRARYGI